MMRSFIWALLAGSLAIAAPRSPIAPSTAPAQNDPAPLRIEGSNNPDDIVFLYPNNRPIRVSYDLSNRMSNDVPLSATFTLVGRDDQVYRTQTRTITVPAGQKIQLLFNVDPKGLLLGQYSARLSVQGSKNDPPPFLTYIGLITPTDLPKAKPGEFMFGLDTSLSPAYEDPRLLRFTQLMGTDIVRGGTAVWADLIDKWDAELNQAAPIYRQYHLKLAYDIWPPDNRVKDIPNYMTLATRHLEWAARTYKDLIPYFELGNEPDIGFFQGPIKMYADEYLAFRSAIKRGNPHAVVVNGGWAYNLDRINEFYTHVRPEDVDMIAYHGHGDVTAEESDYRRVHAIATSHGFGDKGLVETESGIMALSTPQEDIQARVCVEKLAFAQAMGEPFFHWFRLALEFEGDYSSSWQRSQPRPSVLSYRATVQTLRGYRYKQTLELPAKNAEAYLFEQIDGPGRACVMWINGHTRSQAYLHVADVVADAHEVCTSDIYGNHHPFALLEGGIAALPISDEPVWLLWNAEKPFTVAVEPPLIQTPTVAELQVNAANTISIAFRNPLDHAVDAKFDVQAQCDARLDLFPAHGQMQLAPHQAKSIDFTANVGAPSFPYSWPSEWTVFTRTAKNIDLSHLDAIPDSLPGPNGPVTPTREVLRDDKIDLARLAGYHDTESKIVSIVMANINSTEDRTIRIGTGADFWMEWFCNGKPVFDDLVAGNGPGYTILDHPFDLPLKKGRNLLVGRVLAGGHGYTLAIGSPTELERANGSSNRNTISLHYTYDGGNTIDQKLAIELQQPIEPIGTLSFDSPRDTWEHSPPTLGLGENNVVNLHFKEPDPSQWWKGYDDLSATCWLRADTDFLYLVARVNDDTQRSAPDAARLADFDSIELAFSPTGKSDVTAYLIGLVNDKPAIFKLRSAAGLPVGTLEASNGELRADIKRDNKATFYKIALSRKLATSSFFFNFLVNDNDNGTLKQYLEWKPGMKDLTDPSNWYRVRFSDGR